MQEQLSELGSGSQRDGRGGEDADSRLCSLLEPGREGEGLLLLLYDTFFPNFNVKHINENEFDWL